jgi:hypothetical protein
MPELVETYGNLWILSDSCWIVCGLLVELWCFRSYKIVYTFEARHLRHFASAESQEEKSNLPTPPKPGGMGHPEIQTRRNGLATQPNSTNNE